GRLGSFLFFFFGSLSYIPFLHKQGSLRAAIQAITHQREYLPTIFPYRGELWGTWSQVTYLNQRHFASAIGILLLVLIFLVVRYRTVPRRQPKAQPSADMLTQEANALPETAADIASVATSPLENLAEPKTDSPSLSPATEVKPQPVHTVETFRATLPGFIFSGVLLGLLPMWNSAVFLAASAVLGVLFVLFPLRGQMLVLGITSGVIALPQMLYLSTGSGRASTPRLLHWGYTLDHPTAVNV